MKFERDRPTERRLLAATLMVAAAIAGLLLLGAVIEPRNPEAFGRMGGGVAVGFAIIGWRWPDSVLDPLSRLFRRR